MSARRRPFTCGYCGATPAVHPLRELDRWYARHLCRRAEIARIRASTSRRKTALYGARR